jgi:ATP/maltotriose-dependent transcriptional regulator MalT
MSQSSTYGTGESAPAAAEASPQRPLSQRELEVLETMAEGATNLQIADRLGIALCTVKTHVRNILRKLRVANRTQAVAQYLRR